MSETKYINRTDIKRQKGFKVVIDRKTYTVSSQVLSGLSVKRIAGITQRDDDIARSTYGKGMGWFAFLMIRGDKPDYKLADDEKFDLLEAENHGFLNKRGIPEIFTACNGTFIIEEGQVIPSDGRS